MDTTKLRRTAALLTSAALLASLTVAIVGVPAASATPKCDGHTATIVGSGIIIGTDGPDVIVGSNGADTIEAGKGRDIICGRRGDDVISGGGGRDRIFGGRGDDIIAGGGGGDDIFGFRGNDFIRGQGGNDFINGGRGTDNCGQGPGSGRIRNCEKADFKVTMSSPAEALAETDISFTIKVRNRGPARAAYSLDLKEVNMQATCGAYPWEGLTPHAPLRPRKTRTHVVMTNCEDDEGDGFSSVEAEVKGIAKDRRSGNNKAVSRTELN